MAVSALAASGVSAALGGRPVLHDVDLEVHEGEVLALLGPNGAGKSTLLHVLAGDITPSAGAVTIGSAPLTSLGHRERARRRAVLTQQNALTFPFLVAEVIEMGRAPWARTPSAIEDDAAIAEAIERTDVGHLLERRFTELSGGERARVSLARVLAQRAPVVLLDEPTAALDLRHQEEVMRVAAALAAEGRAVVVVEHDLSLAGAWADRVALLDAGRLVRVGPPAEVLTADLVGRIYGLPVGVLEIGGRPVVIPERARLPS